MVGHALALALTLASGAAAPYAPGERTDYTIEFLGVRMGKARLSVGRPEGAVLPVFLEAKTAGVGSIYSLREQLSTLLDAATGLPRATTLEAWEGRYHHLDTTRFDRDTNVAIVRQRGKYDNTYQIPVAPDTLEFLALVFELRKVPLAPGMQLRFSVLQGKDLRTVTVNVGAREILQTPQGKIASLKVRIPTGLTGQFAERDPTFVWFSDDPRRLVVRISTHFAVGRLAVALESYQPGVAEALLAPRVRKPGADPPPAPRH